ncbi:MAG: ABC transporter ATP-binding protein [Deltaproteobacteria bacterium]|jgi:iron complex transport system ATP-binding protein|nr:ABC transporter ATP-binding protein [Deltaproteobacteria bacterium]
MIEVRDLSFAYYKGPKVLQSVTFRLDAGQTLCVLGPNGSGKTTLLKAILGFLPLPKHAVFIAGQPIETYDRPSLARLLAYVPQNLGAVFGYKVKDMVAMGRTGRKKWGDFDQEDLKKARAALELVGILSLAERPVTELSGGQARLTIIARALAQDSRLILMDEPTSGLDLSNQALVLSTMKRLNAEAKVAFLMTTHHPEQAVYLGGEALLMKAGRALAFGEARTLTTIKAVEDLYDLKPGLLSQMGLSPVCLEGTYGD